MQISIYNIQDKPIGGGGMGEVYRGWDVDGNAVAIKKMRVELTTDASVRSMFHKEVNTLTQFDHPSIVNMYGSFEERGNLYLVMEYVEGETIEQYVRRHSKISESEAVRLFVEILSAVDYVHQLGFVHRDIKPSNIIIKPDGRICLIDFGIVKDMKNSTGHTVTQIIGTDGYMSPEQAMPANIDHRSDIYSLGCVLYYMLVGNHAIQKQSNDHATKMTIIKSAFPKAQYFNPNLSNHIQKILDKATNKNMRLRFQSCREFEMEMTGGGTVPNSDPDTNDTVSVGRENCDINIPHPKVSRHHLDIVLFDENGKRDYLLTDRSMNGTVINGAKVHNNQTGTFLFTKYSTIPEILLAGEVELKWADVEAAFARKRGATKPPATNTPPTFKPTPTPKTEEGQSATGWLVVIYIFAALGGLLGLAFGISIYRAKLDLSEGGKAHKYKQSHRTAALIGAILGGVSMIVWKTLMNI
ncbi:MAG: protein kinase [Prevotellaceae bacterium]|jgi:serine/threonine-protein kinase|nr:protein kinase [Prevotellaceae bacterium]